MVACMFYQVHISFYIASFLIPAHYLTPSPPPPHTSSHTADRDPTYGHVNETLHDSKYWPGIVSDIRALPCVEGQPVVWNQMLWHYGSHSSSRSPTPRYSVSIEFQSKYASRPYGVPLHSPHTFPSFDDRLRLIAIQIVQFRHMLTSAPELLDFIAGDIIERLGGLSVETVENEPPFHAPDPTFHESNDILFPITSSAIITHVSEMHPKMSPSV